MPDGRQIIFDYKTGKVKAGGWDGDRPDEPQLPLYCATSDQPIAGAVFALIQVGELEFKGLADPGIAPPGMKKMNMEVYRPFREQRCGVEAGIGKTRGQFQRRACRSRSKAGRLRLLQIESVVPHTGAGT